MSLIRRWLPGKGSALADATPAIAQATCSVEPAVRERTLASAAEHARAGRYAAALCAVREAMRAAPDGPELVSLRGSILFEWGRVREARADLESAVRAGVSSQPLLLQLGWACLSTGAATDAETWMRRALAVDPDNWTGHYGLATVLRTRGDVAAAMTSLEAALARSPDNADCLSDLVGCMVEQRRFDRAELYARRAIAAHQQSVDALNNLGAVLLWQDRFAEANAVYGRIATMRSAAGAPVELPFNAGIPLRDGGRVDEALAFYERILPQRPDADAHGHYSFALLKAGHLREGFDQYEFRWAIEPLRSLRPRFGKPEWNGQPLAGKTILVSGEQGIGDVIQFMRYLPLVKAQGAKVRFLLRKPIREVLEGVDGVDEIIDVGGTLPDFDYYTHVMSLAHAFDTDRSTIPSAVPYMRVPADRLQKWQRRIGAGSSLRVGIVWAADPAGLRCSQKSVPVDALKPLGSVPGVQFFSLQKGAAAAEAASLGGAMNLVDLSPDIADFADTAAIIVSLDLVISICTSVAHLAGALAAPVWTMLAEPADWRWMEIRDDTPWYPSMRLFRQPTQGDWTSVVDEIGRALDHLTRNRPREAETITPTLSEPMLRPAPVQTTRSPSRPGMCRITEARDGIFLYVPNRSAAERSLARYGEYLQPQLDLLRGLVRPGAAMLEAGSGVGAHAIALSSVVGDAGDLLVSEQRPAFRAILAQNLAANRAGSVTLLQTNLEGASTPGALDPVDDSRATIDELWLRRLDWLKIGEDADAARVIAGATNTIWTHRPGIFVAMPVEVLMGPLADLIRDFGYHCRRLDTPFFRPENFNRRTDDIFGGRSMPALLAMPEEAHKASVLDGLAALA